MLENVKNLASHNNGETLDVMVDYLKSLGYYIKYKILNTMEYGNIPQNRERIYIVGFNNKEASEECMFPEKILLETKLEDIFEKTKVDDKYYYNEKPLYEKIVDYIKNKNAVYQWRRKYVRENKSGVCPTLIANMGTGGHNVPIILDDFGIRKLIPRECARLQGFDDSYVLPDNVVNSHLYKQIGNSVSIPVIQRIAENIKKVM